MKILTSTLLALIALGPAACKKDEEKTEPVPTAQADAAAQATAPADAAAADQPKTAVAEMKPTQGNETEGTVTFTEKDGQVEVAIEITGLAPGDHGFHIHEKGDCSAPDATSAGGHFNPKNTEHGAPGEDPHHAGDFGNLTADDSGKAEKTMTVDFIALGEGETDVVGKAVIVHEKADDLKSQPTGDAGGRLACGVIEMQGAGGEPTEPTEPAADGE